MSSANNWNYEKAIPAFKKAANNPITEAYTPYGLPYYVIIAAMLNKQKLKMVTNEYDFEISNGGLVRALGPSVYSGSKMHMGTQPRPVFRPWPEYMKTAQPIVNKDLRQASTDYAALMDKVELLYNSQIKQEGSLSETAIAAMTAAAPFKTAPDESFRYTESQGFHLELKQPGGATELDVGMDLKTGKINTTFVSRAIIDRDVDYARFTAFVVGRKIDLEAYAKTLIPALQASPFVANEAKMAGDIKAVEKDIDVFYNKHCKAAIEMLKGANQLQTVI